MKSLIATLLSAFALSIASSELRAATPPQTLILFKEPPNTYVDAVEAVSLEPGSVVFVVATLPDGKKVEIPKAGIIAVVAFPPPAPLKVSEAEASTAIKDIEAEIQKYPQFRSKLQVALTKWLSAIEYSRQVSKSSALGAPKVDGIDLEIDGVKYHNAELTAVAGSEVVFYHADGVAKIPASKLTTQQVESLNKTNSQVRIDLARIAGAQASPGHGTGKTQNPVPGLSPSDAGIAAKNLAVSAEVAHGETSKQTESVQQLNEQVRLLSAQLAQQRRAAADAYSTWQARWNKPDGEQLRGKMVAANEQVQLTEKNLAETRRQAADADSRARADKAAELSAQNQKNASADKVAREKQFQALQVNTDRFVIPKLDPTIPGPSYEDTVAFIQGRMAEPVQIGFGEKTGQLIVRADGVTLVFNPKNLNIEVKYGTDPRSSQHFVQLECRNFQKAIQRFALSSDLDSGSPDLTDNVILTVRDKIEAAKTATAFAQLIRLFGGSKDSF